MQPERYWTACAMAPRAEPDRGICYIYRLQKHAVRNGDVFISCLLRNLLLSLLTRISDANVAKYILGIHDDVCFSCWGDDTHMAATVALKLARCFRSFPCFTIVQVNVPLLKQCLCVETVFCWHALCAVL